MDAFYADGGALVIDPNNSSILYSGGYQYYYDGTNYTYYFIVSKSTDQGTSWERDTIIGTLNNLSCCYALAIDRSNSNIVYAGGNAGSTPALFKTTNGGISWFSSYSGLSGTVYDIKIGSTKANILYAGTSSGVYKSTNAGANWTNTGLSASVQAVLINPSNENEIYAATTGGVYKSTTGGGSWTLMNTGLQNTNTTSLGIYPNNYLFVGTNGSSMYRWSLMVGTEEQNISGAIKKLTVEPNPSNRFFRITYELIQPSHVNLSIYDIQGRFVKKLINAKQTKGTYSAIWDGTDERNVPIANGIYFTKLETGGLKAIQKLILNR